MRVHTTKSLKTASAACRRPGRIGKGGRFCSLIWSSAWFCDPSGNEQHEVASKADGVGFRGVRLRVIRRQSDELRDGRGRSRSTQRRRPSPRPGLRAVATALADDGRFGFCLRTPASVTLQGAPRGSTAVFGSPSRGRRGRYRAALVSATPSRVGRRLPASRSAGKVLLAQAACLRAWTRGSPPRSRRRSSQFVRRWSGRQDLSRLTSLKNVLSSPLLFCT